MAFEDVDEAIFETVSAAAEALNLSFGYEDDLRAMEKARLAYGGRRLYSRTCGARPSPAPTSQRCVISWSFWPTLRNPGCK